MRLLRAIPLRWKFVLVVVLGAVVPLGVLGFWLARSAERTGDELLRERLRGSLREMVDELGVRWVAQRSALLEIAEHPLVQAGLVEPDATGSAVEEALRAPYGLLQENVPRVVVRDGAGVDRWTLRPDPATGPSLRPEPFVPMRLPIYDRGGNRLGTLDARLRLSSLLTGVPERAGVGAVLGIFELPSGTSLLPLGIDQDLFRQRRFEWAGELWVGESQVLSEPSLELVLAAVASPFEQPYAQATRRGTLALLAVAAGSLVLVTLVTTRITRSLRDLAHAADAISTGDLDRKVPETGGTELERVARAFNSMTDNLRRSLAQLARGQSFAAVGEFAASLAHEVRNPLSAIRVNLQSAEERMVPSPDRELVTEALRSIERLEDTVTGALQVARSGRVLQAPLDLRPVLTRAMRSAEPEFRDRGVHLEALADAGTASPLLGDAAALEQVFLNLLLNAAQAQATGGRAGIRLRAGGEEVEVEVWDEGPGLSPDESARAFEPFYSTKDQGTGLGLSVARQIVAAHGGEIEIASEPGKGTRIRVRLPLGPGNPRTGSRAGFVMESTA